MDKKVSIFLILTVLVIGSYFVFFNNKSENEGVFCTMEAKLCPDGSYVGRTGPKCEFAVCPEIKNTTKAKLGIKILNNGVYITPLEVVSDSRCPVDVTCIWAGEVSLKIRLDKGSDSKEETITTLKSVSFSGKTIELKNVSPASNSKKTILPSDYEFEFSVN